MTDSIHGVPPGNPDGRGRQPHPRLKEKKASKVKEQEVFPKDVDEYIPTDDLVCEIVSYGNDPKLKRIICRHKNQTPQQQTKPPLPDDLEFEEI